MLGTVSFLNKPSEHSFTERDYHAISSTGYTDRLTRCLTRFPYRLNVHFAHMRLSEDTWSSAEASNCGLFSESAIRSLVAPEFRSDPNGIDVVLTNNFADQQHPLTPWILIHRFAHALEHTETNNIRRFGSALDNMCDDLFDAFLKLNNWRMYSHEMLYDIMAMMTTASAKAGTQRETDTVIELMTQFIVTGRITFNYAALDKRDHYSPTLAAAFHRICEKHRLLLMKEFTKSLSRASGESFVI